MEKSTRRFLFLGGSDDEESWLGDSSSLPLPLRFPLLMSVFADVVFDAVVVFTLLEVVLAEDEFGVVAVWPRAFGIKKTKMKIP